MSFVTTIFALSTFPNGRNLNQQGWKSRKLNLKKGCLDSGSIFKQTSFLSWMFCNSDKQSKSWIRKLGINRVTFTSRKWTTNHFCIPFTNHWAVKEIKPNNKDYLVYVLDENPCQWSKITEGLLFAHHKSRHYLTNYLSFFTV